MLDIYLIDDTMMQAEEPGSLHWIGSLSLEEHAALQHLWDVLEGLGFEWSYFDDWRIDHAGVSKTADVIQRMSPPEDEMQRTAFEKVQTMIRLAQQNRVGLCAFAD